MKDFYKITFNKYTYDQYDSFIVCAKSRAEVIEIVKEAHPGKDYYDVIDWDGGFTVNKLKKKKGIILSSFNAG